MENFGAAAKVDSSEWSSTAAASVVGRTVVRTVGTVGCAVAATRARRSAAGPASRRLQKKKVLALGHNYPLRV